MDFSSLVACCSTQVIVAGTRYDDWPWLHAFILPCATKPRRYSLSTNNTTVRFFFWLWSWCQRGETRNTSHVLLLVFLRRFFTTFDWFCTFSDVYLKLKSSHYIIHTWISHHCAAQRGAVRVLGSRSEMQPQILWCEGWGGGEWHPFPQKEDYYEKIRVCGGN